MESAPVLHPIVTEPGALFGSDTTLGITDETPDIDKFMAMLTMPNGILDVLIDPERTPKHPLTKWVNHHARITSQTNVENVPKNQRRRLARRRYWNENIGFYTAAHRRLTRSADFPTFSDSRLARMLSASPMVGLSSELFLRRFIDHQSKWRRNDLIDVFHLSSAAAYANYVCAETHTGNTAPRCPASARAKRDCLHDAGRSSRGYPPGRRPSRVRALTTPAESLSVPAGRPHLGRVDAHARQAAERCACRSEPIAS